MSGKVFVTTIVIIVAALGSVAFLQKKDVPVEAQRLGYDQPNEGAQHIEGQGLFTDYKAKIPTSGPHSGQTTPWQAYDQQIPDQNLLHNMEHGGLVISYRPDTDPATVQKLKSLFTKPYSRKDFNPSKAIIMPREGQEKLIVIAGWDHIVEFDTYDEQSLMDQYRLNIGKAPEAAAG